MVARAPASRVGGNGFKTEVVRRNISNPGTYRFAVFSYDQADPCSKKHACVGAIPNRYPLVPLDYKDPSVTWRGVPEFSTDAAATLTSPVSFSVGDNAYGSGIKGWTLQRRDSAGGTWEDDKRGREK